MIVAVTSTGSAKVRALASGILRLDASLSGEPLQALLGVEQTIRMENFFLRYVADGVTILDENGHTLISLTGPESKIKGDPRWMQERSWFGYTEGSGNWC